MVICVFGFHIKDIGKVIMLKVYVPYGGRQSNRVTSISNTGQPTTAKQVDFNLVQSLHSSN